MYWQIAIWLRKGSPAGADSPEPAAAVGARKVRRRAKQEASSIASRQGQGGQSGGNARLREPRAGGDWRLSPFRLLLFVAFSFLSLQATRNSHQFAAVVGHGDGLEFRRMGRGHPQRRQMVGGVAAVSVGAAGSPARVRRGRLVVLWVGSGQFFRMTGEGRTIGLGEDRFGFRTRPPGSPARRECPAGFSRFTTAMPRSSSITTARSARFTPIRGWKSPAPTSFAATSSLARIRKDKPGWEAELAEMGRPVILSTITTIPRSARRSFGSDHWRCVWFDAIAAVFVHDSFRPGAGGSRRFRGPAFPAGPDRGSRVTAPS